MVTLTQRLAVFSIKIVQNGATCCTPEMQMSSLLYKSAEVIDTSPDSYF